MNFPGSINVFVISAFKHFDHVLVVLFVGNLTLFVLLDFVNSLDSLMVRFLQQSFVLCFINYDWHFLIFNLLRDKSRLVIVFIIVSFPWHFRLFVELVIHSILEWLDALNHFSCSNFVIHYKFEIFECFDEFGFAKLARKSWVVDCFHQAERFLDFFFMLGFIFDMRFGEVWQLLVIHHF